jgi:hypothetical protein
MPLFTSASGFQINGGTFIDNAGDLTIIHTAQTVTPEQNISSLEFVIERPSRELSGVERNDRGFGATRTLPYGMSPAQCHQQDPMKSKRCFSPPTDFESDTELIPPSYERSYLCCIWSIILELSAIYICPTGEQVQFSSLLRVYQCHTQLTRFHCWTS